ncbi:hypothetical protein [Nocardia sp. NPDC059239]|uniref:hypothetical protein n=1 Tax=Nocardia sp. NPDC059239 TaxID=3346785 RepID=UPI00368DF2A8
MYANPWHEILTAGAVTVAGGSLGAGVIAAAWMGLKHMPGLLDLSIRLTTWGSERRNRKQKLDIRGAELRNRRAELDTGYYDLLYARVRSIELREAEGLLGAIDEVGALGPIAETIDMSMISADEVSERRRRTLRLVRSQTADL